MNAQTSLYGRLFPLYLAPIDWCFLCDDSPQVPMVFYVELEFSGDLDRDGLEESLREVLQRHPLLQSVVAPAKRKKLCWILDGEVPPIDWTTKVCDALERNGEYLDITRKPGFKVWGRQSSDSTSLTMQFHHTATDGTGAYRFIGDWLACYMRRLKSCAGQVELGEVDTLSLKGRPEKMRGYRAGEKPTRKFLRAMAEAKRQFLQTVEPLKLPKSQQSPVELPGIVNEVLSSEQLAAIRKRASAAGVTVNDLLLCSMFQTLRQWNSNQRDRHLRILVPSDTRDGQDFELPACNMTTYNFLGLPKHAFSSNQKLLDSIQHATLEIKQGELQRSFVDGLTTAMVVPSLLPVLLRLRKCFATCVLSNAGDPSRRFTCRLPKQRGKVACEEFSLEAITGVPPLRRNTHCTMSSSTYGRQLTLSMRCSPQRFDSSSTRSLLKNFCQNLLLCSN